MATYSNSGNIGWDGFEVVKRSCCVPHDEIDGDEENTKNDGEGATDNGEQDILLKQQPVPRPGSAGMVYIS